MLEASLAPAAGTATHRFATSKAHWAHGHGELSLGRSADPWRVAEARDHRLRTPRHQRFSEYWRGTDTRCGLSPIPYRCYGVIAIHRLVARRLTRVRRNIFDPLGSKHHPRW